MTIPCNSYEDRLSYLGLWTLEERINRQDLVVLVVALLLRPL